MLVGMKRMMKKRMTMTMRTAKKKMTKKEKVKKVGTKKLRMRKEAMMTKRWNLMMTTIKHNILPVESDFINRWISAV